MPGIQWSAPYWTLRDVDGGSVPPTEGSRSPCDAGMPHRRAAGGTHEIIGLIGTQDEHPGCTAGRPRKCPLARGLAE